MPIRKEILYPIFLECCQHAKDTYWENVFEDLAYGKTPYGTYIAKDFLCCSYRKRDFSYKIERKTARVVHNEVYVLLSDKLGLLSQQEKAKRKKAFTELETTMKDSRKSWAGIRKKNTKELLIELYVTEMKKKYSLTLKQARFLLSTIFVAMAFKVITADDVDYRDERIHSIAGISLKKKEVIIERDLNKLDISLAPHIVMDKKRLSESWPRYIKDLKKAN